MKGKQTSKKSFGIILTMILAFVFALAAGITAAYASAGPDNSRTLSAVICAAAVICAVISGFFAIRGVLSSKKQLKELKSGNDYYRAILDGIPFPVHAVNKNMKWIFMNRAFENMILKNGKIKGRASAYGMLCENAGASICGTDKCGIAQLKKGTGESYFDWAGKKCKQNTAEIIGDGGVKYGYVETVTDLSNIIEQNEYNRTEIIRMENNLVNLANGNLNLDLNISAGSENTKEIHDVFVIIAKYIDKVKTSLENMTEDAEKLCSAAIEGKLETRIDASRHNGEYKKVIEGLNATLEAVVQAVKTTYAYVVKLSNGEEFGAIDESRYKGDYAEMMMGLNKLNHVFFTLKNEAVKLEEAGINGDFSARGDTSELKGGAADIINGINSMLESFSIPINEVKSILEKMSVNDFTGEISSDYKGVFSEFAGSVNRLKATFLEIETMFLNISTGDFSAFDSLKKKSKNDKLIPASLEMMQSIQDLIDEVNVLAENVESGNLSDRADTGRFKGKYKDLVEGINRMLSSIETPVSDTVSALEKMADGDLSYKIQSSYKGDYDRIKTAFNLMAYKFNAAFTGIDRAASQVASGSKEIASGSQNLSNGSTEQASSVEELTASVTDIAGQTKSNAQYAKNAEKFSKTVQNEAAEGNKKMKQMQEAMRKISDSSMNIAKIIKVIDDIAFQTNILSLNAAVEAARAGQAGKGFAVVAEEVRNLAARSAKAARETTALIEDSGKRVKLGMSIADETAAELEKILKSSGEAAQLVRGITESSVKQATGISQIDKGLEQVSGVVQTNSATAEQAAAASEELSAQAAALKQMLSQFRLNDTADDGKVKSTEKKIEPDAPDLSRYADSKEFAAAENENHAQKQSANKYGDF